MEIKVFDFKKDWHLVEPHLNNTEVSELLDQGMLKFSLRDDTWGRLPLWNKENGHGPWEYTKSDAHNGYAFQKQSEDPEYNGLLDKYHNIVLDMGVDLDEDVFIEEFFQDSKDLKVIKIASKFYNELDNIYSKYLPKKNTYRWYQCYGAADYLCEWSKKLAENIFPKYEWKIFRKYTKEKIPNKKIERYTGCTTTIGKSEEDYLIFDIILFDDSSADEILEAVGLDTESLAKEFG